MSEIEKFTNFVIDKRQALGLSVADLAEKVFGNRRNTYIRELESRRRKGVTIDMMERILKALDSEIKYNEL